MSKKILLEDAQKEFVDRGYTLLSKEAFATKKMEYLCNKHPDVSQWVDLHHLRRGQGCVYCKDEKRGPKAMPEEEIIELCKEHDFEFVQVKSERWPTGAKYSAVYYICNKHREKGVQKTTIASLRKAKGCWYCSGKGRTTEDFIKKLNNPNIEVLGQYVKCDQKIKCRCKIDGTVWYPTPNTLLNGQGCPECGRIASNLHSMKSNNEFIQELAEKNPTIEPLEEYKGVFKKIKFKCKECSHEWLMDPDAALHALQGCPICSKIEKVKAMSKTNEQFLKELAEINPNLEPLEEYINGHDKISVRCKIHNYVWSVAPIKILTMHTGCPKCVASNNENIISSILTKWGYQFELQKRFSDCKDKNTLPFDFYLPEYNICIEYDGEQHYFPIRFRGVSEVDSTTSFNTTVSHDCIKTKYCLDNKIPLIRIPYWEADNMESFLFDEMVRYGAIELKESA